MNDLCSRLHGSDKTRLKNFACGILLPVVELAYHYTPAGTAKTKKERKQED
jgi:hypothetical protein